MVKRCTCLPCTSWRPASDNAKIDQLSWECLLFIYLKRRLQLFRLWIPFILSVIFNLTQYLRASHPFPSVFSKSQSKIYYLLPFIFTANSAFDVWNNVTCLIQFYPNCPVIDQTFRLKRLKGLDSQIPPFNTHFDCIVWYIRRLKKNAA